MQERCRDGQGGNLTNHQWTELLRVLRRCSGYPEDRGAQLELEQPAMESQTVFSAIVLSIEKLCLKISPIMAILDLSNTLAARGLA